ncbi:MAG: nucleotidyl transferase AbiEii/AbiGii toxin family protein [Actinobacteria bacterium]|nr:nucleotidyl transferase AbiEii/AbiGii toxin family protein [Actinomycetota bacterium]
MTELSLPQKVTTLHTTLKSARIDHAFGGALALAYYAEPRATIDIDLNVFLPTGSFARVAEALEPAGVDVSTDVAKLERDGQCRLAWGRTPVDLFLSYDRIHDEMRDSRRRVPFADGTIDILSPEHLAVCKAVFDRPKDWIDIEQMLVGADSFDRGVAETALLRLVGEHDQRALRFRDLLDASLD